MTLRKPCDLEHRVLSVPTHRESDHAIVGLLASKSPRTLCSAYRAVIK